MRYQITIYIVGLLNIIIRLLMEINNHVTGCNYEYQTQHNYMAQVDLYLKEKAK